MTTPSQLGPSAPPAEVDGSASSTSLGKALFLLSLFRRSGPSVSLHELTKRSGFPKSTVHRLLADLQVHGYVVRRGNGYSVGRQLFQLGNLMPDVRPRSLRTYAMPYLTELYEASHQIVHLGVLDGSEVLYLDKVWGHASVDTPTWVGARMAAGCTALGKAMLAHTSPDVVEKAVDHGALIRRTPYSIVRPDVFDSALARTRDDGVALDREESRLGLTCVGVPVFDASGRPIAAISVSGPSINISRIGSALARAGAGLTGALAKSGLTAASGHDALTCAW